MVKKIVIIGTGGTIAGIGEDGKSTGYKPGKLSASELISEKEGKIVYPGDTVIDVVSLMNKNSDDITGDDMIVLAEMVNDLSADSEVRGFVILHGTDTMEETAYFLQLTVKTDKPVVLTGSMRPGSAYSADGDMNLYQAVVTAASEKSVGMGVLVVFADRIYSARNVKKRDAYSLMAIGADEFGAIGVIRDDKVYYYFKPLKLHTTSTQFYPEKITELPKVMVIYFNVDMPAEYYGYMIADCEGIVVAGAGAGEYSEKFKKLIDSLFIPVVITSRTNEGIVVKGNLLSENTIAGDNLTPAKAAILLRLALSKGAGKQAIMEMFEKY